MFVLPTIEAFLTHCADSRRLAPNTVRAYHSDLIDFCNYFGPDQRIDQMETELIQAYLANLGTTRGLKATTIRRKTACLRVFFSWLTRKRKANDNPMTGVEMRIRVPRRLPRALTRSQIDAVLGEARRRAFDRSALVASFKWLTALVAVELMFATGIRVGELVAIRLEDFEPGDRAVRIQGKGSRERQVYIPTDRLEQLLFRYTQARNKLPTVSDKLLLTRHGRATSCQQIRDLVRSLGEGANLSERVTPHMFRHSAATQLLEKGVDIRVIQRLLGHESITTTQIYVHVTDTFLRRAMEQAHSAIGLV